MKFYQSIRWRLQLWMGLILAMVLGGFGVVAYQLEKKQLYEQIDKDLTERLEVISRASRNSPGGRPPRGGPGRPSRRPFSEEEEERRGPRPGFPDGPSRERVVIIDSQSAQLFTEETGFYYAAWSRGGRLLCASDHARMDITAPDDPKAPLVLLRMVGTYREFYQCTAHDSVLVGQSTAQVNGALQRFALTLMGVGGGVLLLGLGGGWWLTSRTIRPIEAISSAAKRISAGDLSERIPIGRQRNELNQLGQVLNETFEKLDDSFAWQRQFTGDASHELRTPLAVMISETQTALARDRDAAEYKETIEVCLETAQQMRGLTESLLDLARFDSGKNEILMEPVDLTDLVKTCCERLQPLAEESKVTLSFSGSPATTSGDATRLTQVITNLITNAWRYNKANGTITVRTGLDDQSNRPFVEVQDAGQGIAEQDLPHLFVRFYRADQSRSQPGGRTGLGLAICKAIIDAHGGTIQVTSTLGEGSTFRVELKAC